MPRFNFKFVMSIFALLLTALSCQKDKGDQNSADQNPRSTGKVIVGEEASFEGALTNVKIDQDGMKRYTLSHTFSFVVKEPIKLEVEQTGIMTLTAHKCGDIEGPDIHPGVILKEVYLDDLNITQTELSH